jgi:hypothetical protein
MSKTMPAHVNHAVVDLVMNIGQRLYAIIKIESLLVTNMVCLYPS